jgi:crossover junction endodeoxyribonuclease RusA
MAEATHQSDLQLDSPAPLKRAAIELRLPWPRSVNHYFREYAMPPAGDKIEERIKQHGFDGIHVWLRKNTRVMKQVGDEGKEYRAAVTEIVLRERANRGIMVPTMMKLRAYPPDKRTRDLSNLYKCLEDALQNAGVFIDDYVIAAHDSRRELTTVKGGMIVVTLTELVY